MRVLVLAAASFGVTCTVAALMPSYWTFAAVLVAVGLSSITLMTTANSTVQLSTAPEMRGRVMALYMAIFTGGTPLGAPIVGWVADTAGPRWAIGVGAAAGFVAAGIAVVWLVRRQHLRVRRVVPVAAAADAGVVRRIAPRLVPHFTVEHDGDGGRPARERRDEAAAVLAADEVASRTA